MDDSSRYQPYGDYYWCGTGAYWDYPPTPNPMYAYGEPEAGVRQRPSTPTNDCPVVGDSERESDGENDDGHPPADRQKEVNKLTYLSTSVAMAGCVLIGNHPCTRGIC